MLCLLLRGRTKKYRIPRATAEDKMPETLVESREISFMVLIQTIPSCSNTQEITVTLHNKKQKCALQIPDVRCDGGMQTVASPSQDSPVLWENRERGQGRF